MRWRERVKAEKTALRKDELYLRIDAGMHTASIGISGDRSGALVLTCSNDKSAKLWQLDTMTNPPTATLLRTLRVFIGEGAEGELRHWTSQFSKMGVVPG